MLETSLAGALAKLGAGEAEGRLTGASANRESAGRQVGCSRGMHFQHSQRHPADRLFAVSDLGSHTSLFAAHFTTSLTCFLRSHSDSYSTRRTIRQLY